eukprot:4503746-Prymnesium_polylepis.1
MHLELVSACSTVNFLRSRGSKNATSHTVKAARVAVPKRCADAEGLSLKSVRLCSVRSPGCRCA